LYARPELVPRFPARSAAPVAALLFLLAPAGALAQTVGPDEAVNAGNPLRQIRLTDAQKAAIYNAVLQQRVRSSATIPVAVGAPVSPAVELAYLPAQAISQEAFEDSLGTNLKYAMVEGDVVVVDPVRMSVVAVIHGAKP
jgi:hypothetical protein